MELRDVKVDYKLLGWCSDPTTKEERSQAIGRTLGRETREFNDMYLFSPITLYLNGVGSPVRILVQGNQQSMNVVSSKGEWDQLKAFRAKAATQRAYLTAIQGEVFTFGLTYSVRRAWTDYERRQVGFDNQVPLGEDTLHLTFNVKQGAPSTQSKLQTIDDELRRFDLDFFYEFFSNQ